jgi:hypothetical protein
MQLNIWLQPVVAAEERHREPEEAREDYKFFLTLT